MPAPRPSLYENLYGFARNLVPVVGLSNEENDCLDFAQAIQQNFNCEIGAAVGLQDFYVHCGVVLEVEPLATPESQKRALHVSNFILASLEDRHAVVEVDGYLDHVGRVRARSHPLRVLGKTGVTGETVVYAQRRGPKFAWESAPAQALRQPPFRLNTFYKRRVILGDQVGADAVKALSDAKKAREAVADKSKLPVLLVEA